MEKNLKRLVDLINNQENLQNENKFKVASATLIFGIIDINISKYSILLQENLNLNQDELTEVTNNIQSHSEDIDDEIYYIREELKNNMFQVMQFLKILNKFAIIDGCDQKSYRKFELIRDKFLKEHY
jgi:hypothetical protein